MDFKNPSIAVTALVVLVVLKEVIAFLWPFIRPSAPDPTAKHVEALTVKMETLRADLVRQSANMADVLRVVNVLLEQNGKKFDLVRDILDRTKDLWEWHNVSDPKTGGKLWYVPQQLQDNIQAIVQVSNQQTALMQELNRILNVFLTTQQEVLRSLGGGK